MAKTFPSPSNGAIALFNGKCDFNGFEIDESQQAESVCAYGVGVYDPWRGDGTPHQSVACTGFAIYGASADTPGFGISNGTVATGSMTIPSGGTCTFTVDTGVTLAGAYITTRTRLGHARLRAAVPLSFQLENAGDVTTTWPVS